MANITRYSPFDESFDELFRGFFVRSVNFEGPVQRGSFASRWPRRTMLTSCAANCPA